MLAFRLLSLLMTSIIFLSSCKKDEEDELPPEYIMAKKAECSSINTIVERLDGTMASTSGYPTSIPVGPTEISCGNGHYLYLLADGTVWANGGNSEGELGDSTNQTSNALVQVYHLNNIIDISAGNRYSLALKADGTVWAWGQNIFGQLGDSTLEDRNYPIQVNGLSGITKIHAGFYHSLALKADGTVWGWGRNHFSQLGTSAADTQLVAIQLPEFSNAKDISSGAVNSMVLTNDSTLWGLGGNYKGQLGDGTYDLAMSAVQVSDFEDVLAFDCGSEFAVALRSDSTLWSWGSNLWGQLGLNEDGSYMTPTPIQIPDLEKIKSISIGPVGKHCAVIDRDNKVWTWGGADLGKRHPEDVSNGAPAALVE